MAAMLRVEKARGMQRRTGHSGGADLNGGIVGFTSPRVDAQLNANYDFIQFHPATPTASVLQMSDI